MVTQQKDRTKLSNRMSIGIQVILGKEVLKFEIIGHPCINKYCAMCGFPNYDICFSVIRRATSLKYKDKAMIYVLV